MEPQGGRRPKAAAPLVGAAGGRAQFWCKNVLLVSFLTPLRPFYVLLGSFLRPFLFLRSRSSWGNVLFTSFWRPFGVVLPQGCQSPKNVLFSSFWVFGDFVESSILGTLWHRASRSPPGLREKTRVQPPLRFNKPFNKYRRKLEIGRMSQDKN